MKHILTSYGIFLLADAGLLLLVTLAVLLTAVALTATFVLASAQVRRDVIALCHGWPDHSPAKAKLRARDR